SSQPLKGFSRLSVLQVGRGIGVNRLWEVIGVSCGVYWRGGMARKPWGIAVWVLAGTGVYREWVAGLNERFGEEAS
ncbi:hypothetical protein Tco_1027569, partial [Tanacetum coccineum]